MAKPTSGEDTEHYFSQRLPLMIAAVSRLVEAESPSNDVRALNRAADVLSAYVHDMLGKPPSVLRTGPERRPHLRIDLGVAPDIVLIGHFDTVHGLGALIENPVRVDEGRLYGPGALDMKGGVVSMVEIAKRLQSLDPAPNVTLFFNSDEEIGSPGSFAPILEMAKSADTALIFDFGDHSRALRNGARGAQYLEVKVLGKGGHAAYPDRNRSPVEGLARLIQMVTERNAHTDSTTWMTPTTIQGSDQHNVVSDSAGVLFDVRGDSIEQFDAAHSFLSAIDLSDMGLEVEVSVRFTVQPFPVSSENKAALAANSALDHLGWPQVPFAQARGASDANTVAGVMTNILDGFGGWGDGAHSSCREYLDIESMVYFSTLATTMCELILDQLAASATA